MLRDKSDTPSNFTLKLRKHLRTRRLDDVRQLGTDRLVDLSFCSGPNCHHLLLELYAQACFPDVYQTCGTRMPKCCSIMGKHGLAATCCCSAQAPGMLSL